MSEAVTELDLGHDAGPGELPMTLDGDVEFSGLPPKHQHLARRLGEGMTFQQACDVVGYHAGYAKQHVVTHPLFQPFLDRHLARQQDTELDFPHRGLEMLAEIGCKSLDLMSGVQAAIGELLTEQKRGELTPSQVCKLAGEIRNQVTLVADRLPGSPFQKVDRREELRLHGGLAPGRQPQSLSGDDIRSLQGQTSPVVIDVTPEEVATQATSEGRSDG